MEINPQPEAAQDQNALAEDDTEADPELRLRGLHITVQFHYSAFYEYRMIINGECWNIITRFPVASEVQTQPS
jgi:hypothetical protein